MEELRFTTRYRDVLRNAKLCGIVPLDVPRITHSYMLYDTCFVLLVLWKLTCASISLFYNDYEDMMMSQALCIIRLTALSLCLFYKTFRSKILQLIADIDYLSESVVSSSFGVEESFIKMYRDESQLLCRLSTFLHITTTICPFLFCATAPLTDILAGKYTRTFIVKDTCSFEQYFSTTYEVFLFLQFSGFAVPPLMKLTNEFIMISLIRVQVACMKFLSKSIAEIGRGLEDGSSLGTSRKIRTWIQLHQGVIRNIRIFQSIYSPVVVLYSISMIAFLASIIFYNINAVDPNLLQFATLSMYVCIVIAQFYLLSYMANDLADEAEKVGTEVYCFPWYILDVKTENHVRLIIGMANRPIHLMAYRSPSFVINKEIFLEFMVNIISAYIGFSKFKGIEEGGQ